MRKHYLISVLFFITVFHCSCHKPLQKPQHSEPITTIVIVPTTISGVVKYNFFPRPVGGIKIVAHSHKLYYYDYSYYANYTSQTPVYTESAIDSTYTDSNGHYSMTFTADSFACSYSLSLEGDYSYSALTFKPGTTSVLPIPLYKTVDVRIHLNIIHNNRPRLLIYFQENDTSSHLGFEGGGDLQMYTHILVTDDTIGHLYYMYIDGDHTGTKSDTVHLASYEDTATRYFTIDPTTF